METLLVEYVIPFQFMGETKLEEKWTEEVKNRLCRSLDTCSRFHDAFAERFQKNKNMNLTRCIEAFLGMMNI